MFYQEERAYKFSERENKLIDLVKQGDIEALDKAGLNSHELVLLFFAAAIEEKDDVINYALKKNPHLVSTSVYMPGQSHQAIKALLRNKDTKKIFFNWISSPDALTVAMCFNKESNIAMTLIKNGISLTHQLELHFGYKALHMAALLGRTDILQLILSTKEGPALINEFGTEAQRNTPLSAAVRFGKLESVKMLVINGARLDEALDATRWDSCTEEVICYLINETDAINENKKAFDLALDAIRKGRYQVFETLVTSEKFPDLINTRDESGKTLLHYVVRDSYDDTLEKKEARLEMEKLLLSKNPNLALAEDNAHHKAKNNATFDSKKRDLLRLYDVQKKYEKYQDEAKHAGRIKLFGIRFRYSDKAKYLAVTHLIHDILHPNEPKKITKKDERILKHSPEVKSIYKNFSKQSASGGYYKLS